MRVQAKEMVTRLSEGQKLQRDLQHAVRQQDTEQIRAFLARAAEQVGR